MDIHEHASHGVPVLELSGRLTLESFDQLKDRVRPIIDAGANQLVLDLGAVSSVDSIGVTELVRSNVMFANRGGRLGARPSHPTAATDQAGPDRGVVRFSGRRGTRVTRRQRLAARGARPAQHRDPGWAMRGRPGPPPRRMTGATSPLGLCPRMSRLGSAAIRFPRRRPVAPPRA
jgi:anti-anti-sigma factor